MTPDEYQAELIERLRIHFSLFERDCTDAELIEFAKTQLGYYWVIFKLKCRVVRLWIMEAIGCVIPYEAEYVRYKLLYQTAEGRIRLLERQSAALRGHLEMIRRERAGKRPKGRIEG